MRVFDWYVFRNLFIALIFIALTLSVVIFLTQSLRFLELVIESGASSTSFWVLTFLAIPRFMEIVLPLSMMAATIFIYNRMTIDSEMIVMRAIGFPPSTLARPAIVLALTVTVVLWGITLWAAPKSLATMYEMRQLIKAQFSSLLFREGIFNQIGDGLTVYARERDDEGELHGLMIHDSREKAKNPSTILAKRGVLVSKDDGYQVLVFDGSRQEYDPKSDAMHRLNFERYTIDLPDSGPVRQRWKEPDERTIFELLNPNMNSPRDVENLHNFNIEIHRRLSGPMLVLVFTLIACSTLLVGPVDRRGQGRRITGAILGIVMVQGLFLVSFNLARHSAFGVPFMYFLVFVPMIFSLFFLSGGGDKIRRTFLYKKNEVAT